MKAYDLKIRQTLQLPLLVSFALLVIWLLLYRSSYSIIFLSASAAFALSVILSITGYRLMLMLLISGLPLSLNVAIPDTASEIRMPSEFLTVVIAGAFVIQKVFISRIDKNILKHPVTVLFLIFFCLQFFTMFTSSMISVSIKAMIVKSLYFLVFYFACAEAFLKNKDDILNFYFLYAVTLSIVVIYTLYNHSVYDFNKNFTSQMPLPFFADHTIYSACVAFMIPPVLMIAFNRVIIYNSVLIKILLLAISVLLCAAIFFSASRAAWLSLIAIVVSTVLIWFRVKTIHLFVLTLLAILIALLNFDEIAVAVKTNRNDSKKITADFETQAKSITNITSDNSNAERLNRWKCAVRMAIDKPITGFGPGTYQFQYLSYQKPEDMTPISVTSPYNIKKGRGGTAHNELLLVLSESGWLAMILFLVLLLFVIHCGANALKSTTTKSDYKTIAAVLLAFISYAFHSIFNNFLDTDKAAFLFYSAIAALVAYHIQTDIKSRSRTKNGTQ